MPIYNGILQKIDEAEMRRYGGIKNLSDGSLDWHVNEASKEVLLLATPRGCYERYEYDKETHTVLAPTPLVLEGKSIQKHLKDAVAVYIMAVTVGGDVEARSNDLFDEGNYTVGVLVDAGATAAVEQVADQLDGFLQGKARKEGYKTTWRFSPGYGDWPLEAQRAILELSGAKTIGVKTTSSLMLNPQKSVTAIIGIVPKEVVLDERKGCQICTQKNCPSRNILKK